MWMTLHCKVPIVNGSAQCQYVLYLFLFFDCGYPAHDTHMGIFFGMLKDKRILFMPICVGSDESWRFLLAHGYFVRFCKWGQARSDLSYSVLLSTPTFGFPMVHGLAKNSCQVISNGEDEDSLKDKDNLWIPSLLPPFDDFCQHQAAVSCLLCSAEHLARGISIMFILNSWERIFLFSQPITSVWTEFCF